MAKTYFDIPDTCSYCKNHLVAAKVAKGYEVKCATDECNFPAEIRDEVDHAADPDQDHAKEKKRNSSKNIGQ